MKPIRRIVDDSIAGAAPQELFDYGAAHLLRQNERAVRDNGACRYRAANGSKCAFGAFISDERYLPSIENKPVQAAADMMKIDLGPHADLLDDLRCVHDQFSPERWSLRLHILAEKYEFVYDENRLLKAVIEP